MPHLTDFTGINGDPEWIRTTNLPLRRGLLYPIEPRGLTALIAAFVHKGK